MSEAQRELLGLVPELERRGVWEDQGARDMPQWFGVAFGLSRYRAERWVTAGHALERLPRVAAALTTGDLSIFKIEELARFATPEDEDVLVEWALDVPSGAIRAEADARRPSKRDEAEIVERSRWFDHRYTDEGRCLSFDGRLPAAEGALLVEAVDSLVEQIPSMPEEHPDDVGARRADALVALASTALGGSRGAARSSVVVHAQLETLLDLGAMETLDGSDDGPGLEADPEERSVEAATTQDGGVVPSDVVARLLCNADVKTVVESGAGQVLALGRISREPSAAMMRQLRYRDRRCVFPNCEHRRFVHAHHIDWWSRGGPTDLDNLVLLCTFHHKLVHEYRWAVKRDPEDGQISWFRPDGRRYRAGPRVA